jgi:chemotaxis protein MotB
MATMRYRNTATIEHDNSDRWLLTYADMITLLTAFFLMLYAMSVMSKGKFAQVASSLRSGFNTSANVSPPSIGVGTRTTQIGILSEGQYKKYQETVSDLSRFVEQQNWKDRVQVKSDNRGVIISLASDALLFERGKAGVRSQANDLLIKVGKIVAAVPNKVQIEGHTCDLPIKTTQFPSNWELSAARASSILRVFSEGQGVESKRFIAAGFAETRPIQPNVSERNRSGNRRVDIVILKSAAQREADLIRNGEIQRIMASPSAPQKGTDSSLTLEPEEDQPILEP